MRYRQRRDDELGGNRLSLRRTGTMEGEPNGVLSGIALLQVSHSVYGMSRCGVVLMGSEPVVVFGMIVIGVGVYVQRGRPAGRPDQRREQQ